MMNAEDAMGLQEDLARIGRQPELGPMLPHYLGYQRLSDNAAHATANVLNHHVVIHSDGANEHWTYRFDPGTGGEISATILYALLAALAVGIGVTQLVKADAANAHLHQLSVRWKNMPPPIDTI